MEKHYIDRRIAQMQAEGVEFRASQHVGVTVSFQELNAGFDAIVLTGGAEAPRDLPVPGRELSGVHFAMDFLRQQNRRVAGDTIAEAEAILATGKHVIVIGGGDTGSDCIGTSIRQGALSVTQIEILPKPPEHPDKALTWPYWPNRMRTSSSQAEGAQRDWCVTTKSFVGTADQVSELHAARVAWQQDGSGNWKMSEIAGSEFTLKADLVLLAMGFVHPVHAGLLKQAAVKLDGRGNIEASTDDYQTSVPKVFAAGDMRRGQSLVVWAIREGRQAARAVDQFLTGRDDLPR